MSMRHLTACRIKDMHTCVKLQEALMYKEIEPWYM